MKPFLAFIKNHWTIFLVVIILILIFKPLLFSHQIPFSSNLLGSFFSPWSFEKFPGWSQGIPNKPLGIDDLRIFYPQKEFTIKMWSMGQIPLWNPYNYSGNFHAGLSETAVFYPLFLLFFFLPQLPSWIILQISEPLIATLGMYLFLKLLTKNKIASSFGAIVFGFSGVVLVRMVEGLSVGHTLIWFPFALFGLKAFVEKRKIRYLSITLIALCFSLLAGWFQYAFYIVVVSFLYAVFLFLQKPKKEMLSIFMPFLLFPLLTLFHILPGLQALLVSTRSATTTKELLDHHLMPWYHLLTYLSPDLWGNPGAYTFFGKSEYKESILYIGVVPFFLSFFSLGFIKKYKEIWFFGALSLIGMLLGIDTPITRSILSLPIPVVSSFLPNRIFLLPTLGLSILAAYGVWYCLDTKKNTKKVLLFAVILIGIFFYYADGYAISMNLLPSRFVHFSILANFYNSLQQFFHWMNNFNYTINELQLSVFTKNLFLPHIFILITLFIFIFRPFFKRYIFIVGIFALTIFGQTYFAQKYIPWSETQFVFPQHPVFTYLQQHQGQDRFISLGQGYISSDIPLFYGLYSPDGVGSMYIRRYGELVTYMQNKGKMEQIPRIETRINPSTKSLFTNTDTYMLRFMQIDGIKYVVKLKNETDPEGMNVDNGLTSFPIVWQNNTWQIFSYADVLPRIFWTDEYAVGKNDKDTLSKTFDFTQNPRRIVLEKNPNISIDKNSSGSVKLITYQPQRIVLKTSATGNGLVFISDTYTNGFEAFVDGKKTPILRADYAFRAIAVPKGFHTVVFSYNRIPEIIMLITSGIILLGVLGSIIFARKRKVW